MRPPENLGADVFQPDHLEAGRAAARRLIEDGIRCAGYVHRGGRGWSERLRGFCEIWGAPGRSDDAMHVIDLAVSRVAPGELNGCDAVVFDESHLVARLLLADGPLSDRKLLTIGDAAGWIGGAPCTIVDCAAEEIGRRAAHALLQRIDHNREDAPQLVYVAPHVVEPNAPIPVRSSRDLS
ncbi:MAG: hypothetical protein HZB38_05610 [Planctomycetes bacterium]|nr:hypothetical protein [Planctomycetota bacterium]